MHRIDYLITGFHRTRFPLDEALDNRSTGRGNRGRRRVGYSVGGGCYRVCGSGSGSRGSCGGLPARVREHPTVIVPTCLSLDKLVNLADTFVYHVGDLRNNTGVS